MIKFKKCPFCGYTEAEVIKDEIGQDIVECCKCLCRGPLAATEDDAIRKWNERVNESFNV